MIDKPFPLFWCICPYEGQTSCPLLVTFLKASLAILPFFPTQYLTDKTRDVKYTTKYCLFLHIYFLKMSCGKRRKCHFWALKFENFSRGAPHPTSLKYFRRTWAFLSVRTPSNPHTTPLLLYRQTRNAPYFPWLLVFHYNCMAINVNKPEMDQNKLISM